MTDSSLRELERRFRASGSVEDEAAWLKARLQSGELEQRNLELAARLGAEGPRLATSSVVSSASAHESVHGWLGVEDWGAEVVARAILASASMLLNVLDRSSPSFPVLSEATYAIEEWHAERSAEVAKEISLGYTQAKHAVFEHLRGYDEPGYALLQVYLLVSEPYGSTTWWGNVQWALRSAEEATSSLEVLKAVETNLVPWLLGYSDPVRERVAARQREARGD